MVASDDDEVGGQKKKQIGTLVSISLPTGAGEFLQNKTNQQLRHSYFQIRFLELAWCSNCVCAKNRDSEKSCCLFVSNMVGRYHWCTLIKRRRPASGRQLRSRGRAGSIWPPTPCGEADSVDEFDGNRSAPTRRCVLSVIQAATSEQRFT